MLSLLKHLHMTTAALSILGFMLRGFWAWKMPGMLRRKPVKILPHVIDTLLLLSAIGLLILYRWNPFMTDWLMVKIFLLVVYIGLGLVALKPWYGNGVRVGAFFAAVATFAWIGSVAFAKTPIPFGG